MFAPAYRLPTRKHTFAARHKRKRDEDSDSDAAGGEEGQSSSPEADPTPTTRIAAFNPVNQTDPYYIAGHAREDPLPPAPFPHAAVKEPRPPIRPIQEELAALNPPLYVDSSGPEDSSTSLRRRHVANVTTILHRCMLKGDWQRAYQAWSLLIRTEIGGRGLDVRRNGRWGIGAELLMRGASLPNARSRIPSGDHDREESVADDDADPTYFSDEGFKLARQYYERLIIQHPYTRSSMRTLNATAFYPALFNIWIYEVQERAKRAHRALDSPDTTETEDSSIDSPDPSRNEGRRVQSYRINAIQFEEAVAIADRMDELLMSPPYDANAELKRLRGHVAAWIADIHDEMTKFEGGDDDGRERALQERERAEAFRRET